MSVAVLTDDELVARVRACWPRCENILRAAMDQMHDELTNDEVETDGAFNMVLVLLLHEVFWRRTVLAAAGRCDEDIIDWIETEYNEWDR
jgi:hypothetical protein